MRAIKFGEIYADYRATLAKWPTKGRGYVSFLKVRPIKSARKKWDAKKRRAWWRGDAEIPGTYTNNDVPILQGSLPVLFHIFFFLAHLRSLPALLPFLRRAPSREEYAAESLYHHGCSNNRGLTVPAIYCGHIFILTLIATWYRPRAWLESVRSC